jgi:hypothetical protein
MYWKDINTMDDVRDWLLNAFPDIVTPQIQHFNTPLGKIRFTMRKIMMQNNTDARFNTFNPQIWQDPDGISPHRQDSKHDDQAPFGAYRVWANLSLDWQYASGVSNKRCSKQATWIDTVKFSGLAPNVTLKNCRQWCEQLIRPLTCHCFQYQASSEAGSCEFYQMPMHLFTNAAAAANAILAVPDPDNNIVVPTMDEETGTHTYFPKMKKFVFKDNKKGYQETPGFVHYLSHYSQDDLINMANQENIEPSTPQVIMSSEIEDWIAGGFIGRETVTISVDFASYNLY